MQRLVWTTDELFNALRATYYTGIIAPKGLTDELSNAYRDGFTAALTAIAIHLGLPSTPPITQTTDESDPTPPRTRIIGTRKNNTK